MGSLPRKEEITWKGVQGSMFLLVMGAFICSKQAAARAQALDASKPNAALFPALFVVGDSLFDAGNSVPLAFNASVRLPVSVFHATNLPYGRDFPSHQPTGRFCNGLLIPDILAELVGLPYPPPYLAEPDNIMKGTSFAAAAAVISNQTGLSPIPTLDFYDQLTLFANVREKLFLTMGEGVAKDLISKSLFLIWIGVNDFYLNYNENPLGKTTAQMRYKPDEFRSLLISLYRGYLQQFYELGARKFALMSLPPIGCAPIIQLLYPKKDNETCTTFLNKEAQEFNMDLLHMSKQLQAMLPDAHFLYLNTYETALDIIANPAAYGFTQTLEPCCSTGPHGGLPVCSPRLSSICKDASTYVFWDFAHPTQRINTMAAERFFKGSSPDVQPLNIQALSKL